MATVTAQGIDDGSFDACGINTYSLDSTQFDCSEVGANTVTLYVTDVNGNLDSTTAVVTIADTVNPTVSTQPTTVYLDASGQASIIPADIDNNSSDNCTVSNLSVDLSNFDCLETGANTVKLYVTDVNGNTDSSTTVVTVLDTINPVISGCPANIVASTDMGSCDAIVNWTAPTAADNCNVDSLVSNYDPGDVFPIGTYTVTYIAYDPSMNTDTCSFTIQVSDDEDPVIVNVPADITQSNDGGNCSAIVTWTAPTASDNCNLDSLVSNFNSGDQFPVGTTTVEYIAYDPAMNTDTVSFEVTINDTELPTISCLADTTICSATFSYTMPNGNDNCGVASVVMSNGIASGGTFPVGNTEITFVVTDIHGNVDSCSFVVTRDEQPTVADAGMDQNICVDNYDLMANTPSVGTGSWSTTTTGVNFIDPASPTTTANGFQRGDNTLIWTIDNGVCDASSDTVVITYDEEATVADAGMDQILCVDTFTTLSANNPVVGMGTWSVSTGLANFVNANDPLTIVNGLSDASPNVNSLVWTISNGTCADSRDTVEIKVAQDPIVDAGPDQSVFEDDGAQLSVSSSITAANYSWSPVFSLDNGSIQEPFATPSINTVYVVEVTTADGCMGSDSVEVSVKSSLTIPTAFTPNNDGFNDTWDIKNLDQFESHTVTVYDNFGSELFSTSNYVPWDGKYRGEDLQSGSYYFIIQIEGNGETESKSGIISILR
jgi:gliding motility-associated-like protein